MKTKLVALAAFASMSAPSFAAVDFSALTTGLSAQAEAAAGYVIPIVGVIIGIGLVLKLVKRWAK